MRGRGLWALAFVLSALAAREASALNNKLIAVLPLDVSHTGGKLDPDAQASLEEMLRDTATDVLAEEGWTVLATQNMLQTLRDNGVDPTKCGEEDCQVSTARELKAGKFISGAVQWLEGGYTASIRLIDTETGRILSSARLEGDSVRALRKEFEQKANDFFARGQMVSKHTGPVRASEPAPTPKPAPAPEPVAAPTPAPPKPVPAPEPAAPSMGLAVAPTPPPTPAPAPAAAPATKPPPRTAPLFRLGLPLGVIVGPNIAAESDAKPFSDLGLQAEWRPLSQLGFTTRFVLSATEGAANPILGGQFGVRWYLVQDFYISPLFDYWATKTTEASRLGRAYGWTIQMMTGAVGYAFHWGFFSLNLEGHAGFALTKISGTILPGTNLTRSGFTFGGNVMPGIAF